MCLFIVTDSCNLPSIGAGNQTPVFLKSSKHSQQLDYLSSPANIFEDTLFAS